MPTPATTEGTPKPKKQPPSPALDAKALKGALLMARLDTLATFTEVPGEVTRTYLTPALKGAGHQLIGWMREAGMQAEFDDLGNVIGHYPGTDDAAPAILIGSHYDSVRNAGRYDGPYGVIAAIAAVAALNEADMRLTNPIDVVAFGDEEGVRFRSTLICSRGLAGTLDKASFDLKDADGVRLGDALKAFGAKEKEPKAYARDKKGVKAYLELHIEQGPVLLREKLPVGIVTSIAGASRFRMLIEGEAGHAGTVPMGMRRDAGVAAAKIILAIERIAASFPTGVGTVGMMNVPTGAMNVIPGLVELSIDLRAENDAIKNDLVKAVKAEVATIAKDMKIKVTLVPAHVAKAVKCDEKIQAVFAEAVQAEKKRVFHLPSGAGHDCMAMADLCPSAMLFVRCGNNGISHNPKEIMTAADAEIGARILLRTLEQLT